MRYAKMSDQAQKTFFKFRDMSDLKKIQVQSLFTQKCVDKITEVSPNSAQKLADQPIIVLKKSQKSRQIESD